MNPRRFDLKDWCLVILVGILGAISVALATFGIIESIHVQ